MLGRCCHCNENEAGGYKRDFCSPACHRAYHRAKGKARELDERTYEMLLERGWPNRDMAMRTWGALKRLTWVYYSDDELAAFGRRSAHPWTDQISKLRDLYRATGPAQCTIYDHEPERLEGYLRVALSFLDDEPALAIGRLERLKLLVTT